jgi:RNA polymerase sigma-70 factor (ECF subfamily)
MDDQIIDFHSIYNRFFDDVYRFSFWLSGSAVDAEDITAETFARAWIIKDDLRVGSLKAYLFTIARNLFLKQQRNNRRMQPIEETLPDSQLGPLEITEARLELESTLRAMQKIPEVDRTVLILRAQSGLSYGEIAQSTGLSLSAVKVKIHRDRLKISVYKSKMEDSINESNT